MNNSKKFAKYFIGSFLIAAIIIFFVWVFYLRFIKYTNDAYVHGNQVYITPIHEGFVTSILTDDTFLVKKGQLIVTLDETDWKIALQKAEEELAQTVRQVCELFHQVFAYKAEINLKTAELIRDAQDYLHRYRVFKEQGVSIEDFEHAIAALRAQHSSLEMSGALYYKTLSAVQNTSIRNHPLVIAAADKVRDAWVNLVRCNLYSPVEGICAQRTIQVGMRVNAGDIMMSVIPLDQIWINANYKETQLKYMRIGQKADITADLWGINHVFHGRIVGLPGGAGNAFSLLPPQNLSGNWIKIVQRLPVRVALDPDEVRKRPLRLGLTCRSVVDVRDHGGEMVPKTTIGSPNYITDVFVDEQQGDEELIEAIISANLDPQLEDFSERNLLLPKVTIDLPPILKEAFEQDNELKDEVANSSDEQETASQDSPQMRVPYDRNQQN